VCALFRWLRKDLGIDVDDEVLAASLNVLAARQKRIENTIAQLNDNLLTLTNHVKNFTLKEERAKKKKAEN